MMKTTKTINPAAADIKWYLVDAEGLVLGRLASQIAKIIRGKNKPCYTPTQDCGDYVVVINAEKVKLTGRKMEQKKYYHHTGYVGGIKEISVAKLLEEKPERVLTKAVERMVSRGPLGRQQMNKLRVFVGGEHTHKAQNPTTLDIGAMNPKNKRGA
ncbi:MAG: 50S ribosomal protein L13 [Lactobacillales bacterium]|jgi:large subunit ribosomal protein L13|nr:50S ribosomal protein L13 [Lactobacillales bacterium]